MIGFNQQPLISENGQKYILSQWSYPMVQIIFNPSRYFCKRVTHTQKQLIYAVNVSDHIVRLGLMGLKIHPVGHSHTK